MAFDFCQQDHHAYAVPLSCYVHNVVGLGTLYLILCYLFRLFLISCTFPFSWKHALV